MSNLDHINFDIQEVTWLDLRGPVACLTERLHKSTCSAMSLLGRGGFNTVYKFTFDDRTSYAVGVPRHDEQDSVLAAKQSEIATMMFIRNSGLYLDIPVPQAHSCLGSDLYESRWGTLYRYGLHRGSASQRIE